MIDLKSAPFNLSESDILWVQSTLEKMTLDEKIGQLFMPVGLSSDKAELRHTIETWKPAGMMFRPGKSTEVQDVHRFLQQCSDIPLLIASNLESGGTGSAVDGTEFGCQMQIAATGNIEQVAHLARVTATEGQALGVNWSFSPVVDIDLNPHNPITNVRTFGSDSHTVARFATRYIQQMNLSGMATAAKHFPGDGVDSRDQHIVMTQNTLSCEAWDNSYGKVWRAVIEAGTMAIMAGHISLPAYAQAFAADPALPASLSGALLQNLLREKLGFNGLIVTDATAMVGFTTAMPRAKAVPAAIAAGCDIFLFNKDLQEDFHFMRQGIETGALSLTRVDEAVTRTLAMKASLGLHRLPASQRVPEPVALEVIGAAAHHALAAECARQAVTLVKDEAGLLPLSPATHPRVLLFTLTDDGDFFGHKTDVFAGAIDGLRERGFVIDRFDPSQFTMRDMKLSIGKMVEKYDLALYLANIKPASNKTSLRINWTRPMGIDAPWFSCELPTLFISFGNPYHLFDVPKIPTYINAYTASPATIAATIDRLLGHAAFTGTSPVDALIGQPLGTVCP